MSATACAVRPPMPASISSKTMVAPPPTAAIASAIRDSSPPEAVSATGASGSPRFGLIRNATSSAPVGPGPSAPLAELDPELALPHADAGQLGRDGIRERLRALPARLRRPPPPARPTCASAATSACGGRRRGIATLADPLELVMCLGSAGQQLVVARAPEAALRIRDRLESATRPPRSGPGSASREARNVRSTLAASRSRSSTSRSSSPAQPSSGASRSTPATARSADAIRSAAPSPVVRVEGTRRPSTPPRRARPCDGTARARRGARPRGPGSKPAVSSTSARSSASLDSAAAASRVSSSWRRRAARRSRHAPRSSPRRCSCCCARERVQDVELVRRPRRDGAARTGRTSPAGARQRRRRPHAPRSDPRRRRAFARRRTRAAR